VVPEARVEPVHFPDDAAQVYLLVNQTLRGGRQGRALALLNGCHLGEPDTDNPFGELGFHF
jgi:hypothetical protein